MVKVEKHFQYFRNNIIGNEQFFQSPFGRKKIIYADWTASGRLYRPIEEKLSNQFGPLVANTHTESNYTGKTMTRLYKEAKRIIKNHVNATEDDALFLEGTGMTGALRKIQRMLGLFVHEKYKSSNASVQEEKPVVFITHMEHHSNHISWEETICDVVIVPPNSSGEVCPKMLEETIKKYNDRPLKIGAFTACSNVTGIETPYHQLSEVMHQHGGICFVDFSASAPYTTINMHPKNKLEALDGIFFSPHKFLGGPGTTGIAILSKKLYETNIPDRPGGGTVNWTNPWGEKAYYSNIEDREDGGTPGFLQAIKIALCISLKEEMGSDLIKEQDERLAKELFERLSKNSEIILLEEEKKKRLPIISFYVEGISYRLIVKLLNDVHGIQVRGGCSCAGTYGHYLLNIDREKSKRITDELDKGNDSVKPGWVRISLHPTMTIREVHYIADAVIDVVEQVNNYQKAYFYCPETNEYKHRREFDMNYDNWFTLVDTTSAASNIGY